MSAPIGPSGGSIATLDGLVRIDVPAGALSDNALVTIAGRIVEAARQGYTYYEYELSAVRLIDSAPITFFSSPATHTLKFPTDPGSTIQDYSLHWFNEAGGYWYASESTTDAANLTVTSAMDDFGVFELSADPLLIEAANEEVIYPIEGGVLTDETGEIKVTFSGGDVSERVSVEVALTGPCDEHAPKADMIREFELEAFAVDDNAMVSSFNQPVELVITHAPERLAVYNPDTLKIYQLDEASEEWIEVPSVYDSATLGQSASLSHFSTYSTQGDVDVIFPPGNMYFQVDMHSGAASASIPLDLPSGPGGFKPNLSLNYSSSSVSEMKSNTSMSSWAGVGWNLSVPAITRDPFANIAQGRYFLSMDGVSDLLIRENYPIAPNTYRFHTKRESHLFITGLKCHSGFNEYYEFKVRTKDGTEYQFGTKPTQPGAPSCAWAAPGDTNAPSSLQYFSRYVEGAWKRYHYRVDVSRIIDARGNYADFYYWQNLRYDQYTEPWHPYVRAAYPGQIQWGGNTRAGTGHVYEVVFNQSDFENDDRDIGGWDVDHLAQPGMGRVRRDSPVDIQNPGVCHPHVMEVRYLTSVRVRKLPNSLIREYIPGFGSRTDPDQVADNDQGSNCAVSGNLKLQSWTEKGRLGGTMRTMTFEYENRAVRWRNAAGADCPSSTIDRSKWRPHLLRGTNGFGGEARFYYTPFWYDLVNGCGWERSVVNARSVDQDSADPAEQSYFYEYSWDGSAYSWPLGIEHGQDAEFRGFIFARENRPLGDKVECWYHTSDYLVGRDSACSWFDRVGPGPADFATTKIYSKSYSVVEDANTCTAGCSSWEPASPYFSETRFGRLDSVNEILTGASIKGTSYLYDQFGNVVDVCEYLTFAPGTCTPGYYRRTISNYSPNLAKWIVSTPYRVHVVDGAGAYSSLTDYYYDGSTSLTQPPELNLLSRFDIHADGGAVLRQREYAFDLYGNTIFERAWRDQSTSTYFDTWTTYTCSNTRPWNVTRPGPQVTNYWYDDCVLGLAHTVTDANNVTHESRYDEFGRRIWEWTAPDTEALPTVIYYYPWDSFSPNATIVLRREVAGSPDTYRQVQWSDGLGRLIRNRTERNASYMSAVDVFYDAAGNKLFETVPYESPCEPDNCDNFPDLPNPVPAFTSYLYDVLGRVTQVTNPDGSIRRDTYITNEAGAGVMTTVDERQHKTDFWKDSFGRTTSVVEYAGEGEFWDSPGFTNPVSTGYSYDVMDRLTQVDGPDHGVTPNVDYNITTIQYDLAGWKKNMTDPDSGYWSYTYWNDGLLKKQNDPRGYEATMEYDSLGRISSKAYPGGVGNVAYSYDLSQIHQNGALLRNPVDEKVYVIENGQKRYVTSAGFAQCYLWADVVNMDPPAIAAIPNGPDVSAAPCPYMLAEHAGAIYVIENGLKRHVVNSVVFDACRYRWSDVRAVDLTQVSSGAPIDGTAPCPYTREYRHDAPVGRLTKRVDPAGDHRSRYDGRGQLSQQRHLINNATYDVLHAYDSMGREVSTTYPDGEVVTTTFDQQGMTDTVKGSLANSDYLRSSDYNVAGQPTLFQLGAPTASGRLDVRYAYHSDLRLKSICAVAASLNPTGCQTSDVCPASSSADRVNLCYYSYDGRGNVNSIYDATENTTANYFYDHRDRLESVSGSFNFFYQYDRIGNLTQKTEGTNPSYGPGSMAYGAGAPGPHAITSANGSDGNHTYEYDAMGDMTFERVNGAIRHQFAYDSEGRVQWMISGNVTFYYYDAEGTLMRKVAPGQAYGTVYIGGIYEKNVDTGSVTKYYYADGKRIAMRPSASVVYHLVQDHLGGTAATQWATVAGTFQRARYYPFGMTRPGGTLPPTDKLFTGQQRETTNGIYHYGARFYNADIGRFISADSIVPEPGNPQDLNRYSYVRNNPVRYSDPTGHTPADMEGCWHNGQITCGGGSSPPPGGSYGEGGAGGGVGWDPESMVGQQDPLIGCGSACKDRHGAWLYQTYWAAVSLYQLGSIDTLDWSWEQRNVLLSFPWLGVSYQRPKPGTYWDRVFLEEAFGFSAAMLGLNTSGGRVGLNPPAAAVAGKPVVHWGQQGKHVVGHNNFIPGRSVLTADAQRLLNDYAGTGTLKGNKELIQTNEFIGIYVPKSGGQGAMTTNFTIHYRQSGTIAHIVPAAP